MGHRAPLDWDPRDNGHDVTLNHSYGGKAKPAYDKEMENKPPRYSKLPYYGTGELHFAKMSADSDGGGGSDGGTKGGDGDPSGGGLDEEKGKAPKGGGSTLTQGSEGFWEMQAREKAAEQENASGDSDPRPHVFRGKVGSAKPGMDAGAKRESPGKHDRDYDWWVSRKMKNEEYDSGNDVFYPTEDARVTSGFGERIHPVTKKVSQHKAVDYGQNPNGVGKNVYATVDGEIVDVGTSKDGSNFVVI